jgi:hypothetical protein
MDERRVPIGAKLISIYHFISFAVVLIFGLLFLFAFIYLPKSMERAGFDFSEMELIVTVSIGFILLFLSIFYFFIGIGLWKGREWARYSVIALSVFWMAVGIIGVMRESILYIGTIIISLIFILYLGLSKKVKENFN